MKNALRALAGATALWLSLSGAHAAPILYVSDSGGRLGTVDVATGAATVIGNMGVVMTDIAFDASGNLFGVSFTGFYAIDPTTAAISFIGNHGMSNGNALVFAADGTLYGAGGSSTSLFTINPLTGAGTSIGSTGALSGGDLAFNGGDLYLATSSSLIRVGLSPVSGTTVGPFGFSSVFGLATGDDGVLYGVAGTTVFSVDTATGAGTFLSSFGGTGLTPAFGSSFFKEAVPTPTPTPEPTTLGLLGVGLLAVGLVRRRSGR